MFSIERGHRPGTSKVAVFMVNSRDYGRDTELQQAVQKLRRDGVRVYVIASDAPEQQRLQTLAPVGDITRVTRFSDAGNIVTQLVKYIRDEDQGNSGYCELMSCQNNESYFIMNSPFTFHLKRMKTDERKSDLSICPFLSTSFPPPKLAYFYLQPLLFFSQISSL